MKKILAIVLDVYKRQGEVRETAGEAARKLLAGLGLTALDYTCLLYTSQGNDQPAQVPVGKQPILNRLIRWKHPPAFLAYAFCAGLRGSLQPSVPRLRECSDNR